METTVDGAVGSASLADALPRRERVGVDERGWPVLKRSPGDTTVITDEFVDGLKAGEGVRP